MKPYYSNFDWLRYVAAATVVLAHAGADRFGGEGFTFACLPVQAFFTLSGFLIGGILLSTDDLPRFFYNRATRIWIPYAISVVTLFTAAILKDGITERFFEYLIYDLTFTHNLFAHFPVMANADPLMHGTNDHYWTIAVEEQFYLIAPLLIVVFGIGNRLGLWVSLTVFFSIAGWWFASICAGVAAAISVHRYGAWHLPYRNIFAILAAGLGTTILLYELRWLDAAFAVTLVLALANPGSRSRWGALLGGASYSLYLNHWVAIFTLNFFIKNRGPWTDVVVLGLATAMACMHYLLIDRTIKQRRDRCYSKKLGYAAMLTAYALCFAGIVFGSVMWSVPPVVVFVAVGMALVCATSRLGSSYRPIA